MSSEAFIPLLISVFTMVSWGILGILVAKISRAVGALAAGFLIMFSALLLTIFIWPIFFSIPSIINWQAFIMLGVLGGGVYALFCHLLKTGRVSVIVPITSVWAVVTASLGILFLHEFVNPLKILSIILVISGVVILSVNWSKKRKVLSIFSLQTAFALLAALGWGFYFFFLGPISKQTGWFSTTLLIRIFVTLTLFILLLPQLKKKAVLFKKIPWKVLLSAAILDVFGFTGYNLAVSRYEVSYVSVIASASPLITVILAAVFLKEKTNFIQKLGMGLVIVGIIGLQLASVY